MFTPEIRREKASMASCSGALTCLNLVSGPSRLYSKAYSAAKVQVCREDSLIIPEILLCFVIIEIWMQIVLPALGLQSGEPCPWAGYLRREHMFVCTPLCCLALYVAICGTMDRLCQQVSRVEAKSVYSQKQTMSRHDTREAVRFACRCFVASTAMSGVFYHVMRGESNIHWGWPSLSDTPWVVLVYISTDLIQHGVHGLMHKPWWYENVHKVHHTWKNPNVWVVSALHPAEFLLYTAPTLMVSVMLPLSFCSWLGFFAFVLICAAMDFSGLN
eukprot:TRINITY_DN12827_c0_g1_i1.p1 TRINITY_DN12827_c0_g1~~TRINITY_DN12827_c0_g1_i1.p1  ORF type:complete len:273 (+),score=13.19 TRINITY_DN12827_c0_g1_i1:72-890(+)